LLSSGTTPSCCIRPRASQLIQPSTTLPLAKRAMLTPEMLKLLPRRRNPLRSPYGYPDRSNGPPLFRPFGNDVTIVNRRSGEGGGGRESLSSFSLSGPLPTFGRRRVMVSVGGGKELVCQPTDCPCSQSSSNKRRTIVLFASDMMLFSLLRNSKFSSQGSESGCEWCGLELLGVLGRAVLYLGQEVGGRPPRGE